MWSRNIRSVELAEIGDCAFLECESRQTLIIGSGLQTLGYAPFVYCYQLSNIRVSRESINAIRGKPRRTKIFSGTFSEIPQKRK